MRWRSEKAVVRDPCRSARRSERMIGRGGDEVFYAHLAIVARRYAPTASSPRMVTMG